MAYVFEGPNLGLPAITSIVTTTSTTAPLPWKYGDIQRAVDPTFGAGEFVYLKGCVGTVVGSQVTYDQLNGTTTLAPNTANLGQPVAIAMAANNLTTTAGWYQISGAAVVKKTGVVFSPSVRIFLSATIGRIRATLASGKQVLNARTVNAATISGGVSTVVVQLNRPFLQGQAV